MARKLDKQVAIKVYADMWQEFVEACEWNETSASERVREWMDQYVAHHKQNLRIQRQLEQKREEMMR